jgi:two-component system nitrogen regulation sensor histidine kinase GlnL
MDKHDYAFVLDNLTTAILLVDENLTLQYINPAAEMLLGLSAQRTQGKPLTSIFTCPTEDLPVRITQALQTCQPYAEREIEVHTPGKVNVTVNCTITPLVGPDQVRGVILEVVELNRRLRITREEQILNQNLISRMLIRGLAHEIKNPLGGLRGAAQLLERELDDKNLKEFTDIIIGEADRLQKLVDRLLVPNTHPQKRTLDIHEVIERVRQLVTAEAPRGVLIERDYDPSIPKVHADRNLLIQAVLNIVRNAMHAVGESGTITLRSRIERQFSIGQIRYRLVARIDVMDNGPGVPENLKGKLFYPMIAGSGNGAGLGLSIAQTLVSLHNGLIEFTSCPGHTEFNVYIPISR